MPATPPEKGTSNGQDGHPPLPRAAGKKSKSKKGVDSNEASRLLQARISQLEQDAAGEKDQELEIDREVKRATRDLMQQVSKMDDSHKIDHLTKRSIGLIAESRRLERETLNNKKRGDALQKERDVSRTELSKANSFKEKLEKLCRELQRDNNKMKYEVKDLQALYNSNTLAWDEKYATLLAKLEGYQEEKDTPRKQVVDMELDELFRVRFKSFIEQYELRELHFHSQMRSKEIELQYHLARFDRDMKTAEAELTRLRQLQAKAQTLSDSETRLRAELNEYIERLGEACHTKHAVDQRDDIIARQRQEIQDQSKKCTRLEKDNETLRRQKEATAANIVCMVEEHQGLKSKMDASEKQTEKLKSIIQQMQRQGREVPGAASATVESCKNQRDTEQGEDKSGYLEAGKRNGEGRNPKATEENMSRKPQTRQPPPQPGPTTTPKKVPFGPERPPIPAGNATINGH